MYKYNHKKRGTLALSKLNHGYLLFYCYLFSKKNLYPGIKIDCLLKRKYLTAKLKSMQINVKTLEKILYFYWIIY
jgi:hypothetical protein